MSFIKNRFIIDERIKSIMTGVNYTPIELQLIWFLELLILHYAAFLYGSKKLDPNKSMDVTYTNTVHYYSAVGMDGFYTDLIAFRNTFVHYGPGKAYDLFMTCCRHKTQISEQAIKYGINLNWDKSLYNIITKNVNPEES